MAVFTGLGSAASPSITFSADTNTGIFSLGADQVAISTNGTGRLFVDASGNVGVGTASPSYTLDVAGGVRGRPIPKIFSITKGNVGSGTVETFTLSPDTNVIKLVQNYGTQTSSRSYIADFTAGLPTEIGSILLLEIESSRTNSDSVIRSHRTEIAFAGAIVLTTGNVLIGAGGSYSRKIRRTLILTVDGWRDIGLENIQSNTEANQTILTSGDSYTEAVRIDASGNVGIGTTSPGSALEINAAAATSPFIAKINTAEAARIDGAGNLLVGTSSGTNTLHVAGSFRVGESQSFSATASLANSVTRTIDLTVDNTTTLRIGVLIKIYCCSTTNTTHSSFSLVSGVLNASTGGTFAVVNTVTNGSGATLDSVSASVSGLVITLTCTFSGVNTGAFTAVVEPVLRTRIITAVAVS
jgi:hypothetical protein